MKVGERDMLEFKRAFKGKTIEMTIKNKIDHWLKSLELKGDDIKDADKEQNKKFIDAIKNDIVVTGGAIASMLGGYLPNDYDVYFKTITTATLVANYYISKLPIANNEKTSRAIVRDNAFGGIEIMIKSAGVAGEEIIQDTYDYFEMMPKNSSEDYLNQIAVKTSGKYTVAFMTSNAITLTDSIQIITRFCGEPDTIHGNYDFVHCTNYWTYDGGLVTNPDAVMSILSRELKYVGSKFPICSLFRVRKFIERGWTITAGEIFKISWDVSKLDLNDYSVLREQLTGLDTAYFSEVLAILQETVFKTEKEIDRTYLFELISRTFDKPEVFMKEDE